MKSRKKANTGNRKTYIGLGISGVIFLVSFFWYKYDLQIQACELRDTLCVPTGNQLLRGIIWLSMSAALFFAIVLLSKKYERTASVKISKNRKILDYFILAVFVITVSYLLMLFCGSIA